MAKYLNINDAARAFMKETFQDSDKPYSSDLATTMTQIAELYEEGLTEEQKASIPTGGDYNALADVFYRMVKTMSLSSGAGGGVFVINATYDREEDDIDWYTIDKTPAEIKAAWDAGMMPVLINEGAVNQLVYYDVGGDYFNFDFHRIAVSGSSILEYTFHIYSNGGTDVGCDIIAYESGGDGGDPEVG